MVRKQSKRPRRIERETLEDRLLLTTLVPSELQPGDTYHLAFVTSSTTDAYLGLATGNGIQAGDALVQGAATAPGAVTGLGTYLAILSDSVQNVGAASRFPSTSSPIYNTNGDLVAADLATLFSGPFVGFDAPIAYDEFGVERVTDVWTGTNPYGDIAGSDNGGWQGSPLQEARIGESSSHSLTWISHLNANADEELSLYGLGPEYEVCTDGSAAFSGNCQATGGGTGAIHGQKWHDLNADGTYDGGEPGLNGWTIELVDSSGTVIDSVITHDMNLDADPAIDPQTESGHYRFENVPAGNYTVREIQQSGWFASAPVQDHSITVVGGDVFSGLDFGNYQLGTLTGRICEDLNGNGVYDEETIVVQGGIADDFDPSNSEPTNPRAGMAAEVGNPNQSTGYDATSGDRVFYESLYFTPPTNPVAEAFLRVHIRSGDITDSIHLFSSTWEAGVVRDAYSYASLPGNNGSPQSFDLPIENTLPDMLANGRLDIYSQDDTFIDYVELHVVTQEPCLAGLSVEVSGTDGLGNEYVDTTVTLADDPNTPDDETGTFATGPLVPGSYVVTVQPVPGVTGTTTTDTDVPSGGVIGVGTTVVVRYPTIAGTKFDDINGDGVQQGWEPGLGGWKIFIDENSNDQFDAGETYVETKPDGAYYFPPLPTGTRLNVREDLASKPGWTQTTVNPAPITLAVDEVVSDIDFGNFELIDITGTKFKDTNQNGVWDAGEGGLEGWEIYLDLNDNGTFEPNLGEPSATTDQDGKYEFTDLGPGEYVVREVMQDGWNATLGASGHAVTAMSGVDPSSALCSGARPIFEDPALASFTGQIALATCTGPSLSDGVLGLFDISAASGAYPYSTAAYHHPSWTKTNLGDVFGLALDDLGNVYVTATAAYSASPGQPWQDTFLPGRTFGVYKIDRRTGAVSDFAILDPLPNTNSDQTSALGNIAFDPSSTSFFVSNIGDGRIYRLDRAGTILETFDHASGTVAAGGVADPLDSPNTPSAPNERVWGLEIHGGNLYYSVGGKYGTTNTNAEIWSMPLGISGEFTSKSSFADITRPNTNPISDISFSPAGAMLISERGMTDYSNTVPHTSRAFEYIYASGSWTLQHTYDIGIAPHTQGAGASDYDYDKGGRVWLTGDALTNQPSNNHNIDGAYGLQGSFVGGGYGGSHFIDLDSDPSNIRLGSDDKRRVGDVEIPCPTGVNFGNFPNAIHGQKWHDLNGDGIRQPEEPGLDGWTIEVVDADGNVVASQVTHSMDIDDDDDIDPVTEQGLYWIEGLPVGNYTIREVAQPGWVQTTPGPVEVEGRVQVDNYGQLFSGSESGSSLTPLGPLLSGPQPCCTAFNILDGTKVPSASPATTSDEYLYFTAWNAGGQQGFIADLDIDGQQVLTGTGWEVLATGSGPSPTTTDIQTAIANATPADWNPVQVGPTNQAGLLTYPRLNGIDLAARWIWHNSTANPTTNSTFGDTDHGDYLIFRIPTGAEGSVTVTPGFVGEGYDFGNTQLASIHGQKFHYVKQEKSERLGNDDGFLVPEPTSPSANLAGFLAANAAATRDYDEPGSDKYWGESFTNFQPDVSRVLVNVHLKPELDDRSQDDTISFGVMGPHIPPNNPSRTWEVDLVTGSSLASTFHLGDGWTNSYSPNQATGKLWNAGEFPNGQLQRYTFNAGSPIVKGINQHGRMDVIVQDDTLVDYIEICYDHRVKRGLNDWTITADDGSNTFSQVTHEMDLNAPVGIDPESERGLYWLEDLLPGTYEVSENEIPFWTSRDPASGSQTVTLQSGQILENVDFENSQNIVRSTCVRHSNAAPNPDPPLGSGYEITFEGPTGPLAGDQFESSHGVTMTGLGSGPDAGVFLAYSVPQPTDGIWNIDGYDGTINPAGDEVLRIPAGETFAIEFNEPINSFSGFIATESGNDHIYASFYDASTDTTLLAEVPLGANEDPGFYEGFIGKQFDGEIVTRIAIWGPDAGDIILDNLVWSTYTREQAELNHQRQEQVAFFDDRLGETAHIEFADSGVELVPLELSQGDHRLNASDIPGVDIIVRKNPGGSVFFAEEGTAFGELDGYDGSVAPDGSRLLGIDLGDVENNLFEPIVVNPPTPDTPNEPDSDSWIELDFARGVSAVGGHGGIPVGIANDQGLLDWPVIAYSVNGEELDVSSVIGGRSYANPENREFYWRVAAPEGEAIGSVRFYPQDANGVPDSDAVLTLANLTVTYPEPHVAGRHVFYNDSVFDGNDPSFSVEDDGAIATDKSALLPGGVATFENYTSYVHGINGIMVDLARTGNETITADDFDFKMGNNNSPATWEDEPPAPNHVDVRVGEGVNGSDRITIIWANDQAIKKQWLQVTVKANENTELPTPDVHYWGNAVGETGNDTANTFVNTTDVINARANPHSIFNTADVDDAYDFNRDKFVNTTDVLISRGNGSNIFNRLRLLDFSLPSPVPPVSVVSVDSVFAQEALTDHQRFDFADFLILSSNYGQTEVGRDDGDLNGDGVVGFEDFLSMAAYFGERN